ncbi:hypothetical protein CX658_10025 [Pseudomonas amygdali pv. lachrymans]|nr:hypothetical protein CX658_10025 [Pseudomonas amygdali pv. lachrymans]
MLFWTLRVLLATRSVATCITTLERGNENLNYRATLCVACCSGRSASSLPGRAKSWSHFHHFHPLSRDVPFGSLMIQGRTHGPKPVHHHRT